MTHTELSKLIEQYTGPFGLSHEEAVMIGHDIETKLGGTSVVAIQGHYNEVKKKPTTYCYTAHISIAGDMRGEGATWEEAFRDMVNSMEEVKQKRIAELRALVGEVAA